MSTERGTKPWRVKNDGEAQPGWSAAYGWSGRVAEARLLRLNSLAPEKRTGEQGFETVPQEPI